MNQERSSQHGGARPGAGRKPGSANKKTREIADKAAASGVTPLQVMLDTMAELVEAAKDQQGEARLKLMITASEVAKCAAPYIHPRLASIEHRADEGTVRALSDTERASRLATILERARQRAANRELRP
jgi:hypothetical protein